MHSKPLTSLLSALLATTLIGCGGDPSEVINPLERPASDTIGTDFGSWLSIDASPGDNELVVAGYDRDFGAVAFAVLTPQADGSFTWAYEKVDGYDDPNSGTDVGDRGKFTTMKVTPTGAVWIAYMDVDDGDLHYAFRGQGPKSWITGIIAEGDSGARPTGEWADLELNESGDPVVAFHDANTGTLKVAHFDTFTTSDDGDAVAEWKIDEVVVGQPWSGLDENGAQYSRDAKVGEFVDLVIAPTGAEYFAYYDAGQQRLALASGQPGSYTSQFVTEENVNMGKWPSMVYRANAIAIAYQDITNQSFKLASQGTAGWEHEVIDSNEYTGADSVLIERGGSLFSIYFDGQNNDLRQVKKAADNSWPHQLLIGESGSPGFHNELVQAGGSWWYGTYDYNLRGVIINPLP